jgi:hypothetical protein
MNLAFDIAIYELHHKHGQLLRRVEHLEKEQVIDMSQVEDLTNAVSDLKNNLATKFGSIRTELDKLESEKASGGEPDLTALKDMVTGLDQEVGAFDPTAGDPAASGGGGTEAPPAAPAGGVPAAGGVDGGGAPAAGGPSI